MWPKTRHDDPKNAKSEGGIGGGWVGEVRVGSDQWGHTWCDPVLTPIYPDNPANAARATATSKEGRDAADARTWSARRWPPRPRSPSRSACAALRKAAAIIKERAKGPVLVADLKSGLIIRAQMTAPNGQPRTLIDVKQLTLAAPATSVFALPANCAAAAKAPKMPTEQERYAAETGGNGADFANAIMGPASKNSCAVLVRVVKAGSMEPITRGFQIAVDTAVNADHPAGYTIGVARNGRATSSGGGLREMTAQLRNGVLRIENAPPQFDIETHFGNAGDSSALIYRQCGGPQTVLLFVVKNPRKLSDGGDWLWVKSGKFATVESAPHRQSEFGRRRRAIPFGGVA